MNDMTLIEERTARLEAERENEQEWRREMLERLGQLEARQDARLDRVEGNQRWIIGLIVGLHSVTIGAIFAAAVLF
ncbi:MAG: hypothetical protein OXI16_04240 [Chloroflexota bacterium]|nr:hypothetical protein [Chloroflexota bacterium]